MTFLIESLVACALFTLFVFLMSRKPIKSIFNYPPAIIEWYDQLGLVDASNRAIKVCPTWSDQELQAELQEAARNKQAVRHSEAFRNTYNPHYRIVRDNCKQEKTK